MTISAKELAKILNISAAAVSMALNNKPGVSTNTRKKVFEAAAKYGYDFTKINDKHEALNDCGIIYLLIFKRYGTVVTDTQFFSELTQCIDEYCKTANLHLQIKYISASDNPNLLLKDFLSFNCKGILLLGTEISDIELSNFVNLKIPLVVLDTYYDSVECNYVKINNQQGINLAITELAYTFGSNIGYLSSAFDIVNYRERHESFYKTVREYGFSPKQILCHKLTPSLDGAYSDMSEILNNKEALARAYFADNDLIAYGAIMAFKEHGYHIPDDICIIGFDDIPMCKYTTPTLSTIHVNIRALAKSSITRLLEIINENSTYCSKIEISTSFIKRNSF
ncbi:MAG: LacI family DNA-binding transcriptional regulator [Lachnospira sp.]